MPRQVAIEMDPGMREILLRRHDFFVQQAKQRVLSQFADIAGEADRYADAEYRRLGSLPSDGSLDMSDVADMAIERAQEFFGDLDDLATQIELATLAAMYHQWEKTLREFVERELSHYIGRKPARSTAWEPNLGKLYDVLTWLGWDFRKEDYFNLVDACRLIVNVYKHGKGRSLDDLARDYPQYLDHPFRQADGDIPALFDGHWDYEWLSVTPEQFDEIVSALRAFWERFPEELSRYID